MCTFANMQMCKCVMCKCVKGRPLLMYKCLTMCKCVNVQMPNVQMHKCKDMHHFICTFSHLHICTLLSIYSLYGIHLRLVLLQDTASIVATEAESIAEGSAYGALLCLIEGEVEVVVDILVAVVLFVVDCRRYDVVLY